MNISNKEKPKRKGKVFIMKVSQMINDKGNYASNQFIITDGNIICFQSYDSMIATVDRDNKTISIGRDWDYSKTTGRHRNIFFKDYANIPQLATKKELAKAIADGKYNEWNIVMV